MNYTGFYVGIFVSGSMYNILGTGKLRNETKRKQNPTKSVK
jgi:hypothetical protein